MGSVIKDFIQVLKTVLIFSIMQVCLCYYLMQQRTKPKITTHSLVYRWRDADDPEPLNVTIEYSSSVMRHSYIVSARLKWLKILQELRRQQFQKY